MDHINHLGHLESEKTGSHGTHWAVHHRISAEMIFNALYSKTDLNSLKANNFSY
jgi:hypothetical protein